MTAVAGNDGPAAVAAVGAVVCAVAVAIRSAVRRSQLREAEGSHMDEVLTDVGPVDLVVIRFTGNKFTGEVAPALLDLVQAGTVRVLRGKGMPVLQGFGRGDQRVLVNVVIPHQLTDEQRELLETIDRTSGDETYRRDEGFFEKLKSAFR